MPTGDAMLLGLPNCPNWQGRAKNAAARKQIAARLELSNPTARQAIWSPEIWEGEGMYVVAMPSDLGAHPRPGYNKAIVHKVSISCIADCIRWNQLYQNKIAK